MTQPTPTQRQAELNAKLRHGVKRATPFAVAGVVMFLLAGLAPDIFGRFILLLLAALISLIGLVAVAPAAIALAKYVLTYKPKHH